MGMIVRLLRAWPLIVVLIILALVVYFAVSWKKTPLKAKEITIKVLTIITSAISIFFALASLYSWLDGNMVVLELALSFMVIGLIALGIVRICRWRFVKNHPHYKDKALPTEYL